MLKDITLGQYFPGTSVIHRLDPRTKLLVRNSLYCGVVSGQELDFLWGGAVLSDFCHLCVEDPAQVHCFGA